MWDQGACWKVFLIFPENLQSPLRGLAALRGVPILDPPSGWITRAGRSATSQGRHLGFTGLARLGTRNVYRSQEP